VDCGPAQFAICFRRSDLYGRVRLSANCARNLALLRLTKLIACGPDSSWRNARVRVKRAAKRATALVSERASKPREFLAGWARKFASIGLPEQRILAWPWNIASSLDKISGGRPASPRQNGHRNCHT
jgi:hypothetical protein